MSRNVYVSNTTHTAQPNARKTRTALHQALPPAMKPPCFRRRVMCRRSFIGVGARDDEPESESDEHISLRFLLKPTTVPLPPPPLPPVNASSSFRLRIFLPPPPLTPLPPPPPTTTTDDDLLLIGKRRRRPVNSDDTCPGSRRYYYVYVDDRFVFFLIQRTVTIVYVLHLLHWEQPCARDLSMRRPPSLETSVNNTIGRGGVSTPQPYPRSYDRRGAAHAVWSILP